MRLWLRAAWLSTLSVACVSSSHGRGVQLYAGPAQPDAVLLVGDVKSVDGADVPSRSRTFRLLPGCHVVTNVTYWVGNDSNAAMSIRLPELPYWMNMKEGHSYELRVGFSAVSDTARVKVTALERDVKGDISQRFEPGKACD
jgi:hypothetical protein